MWVKSGSVEPLVLCSISNPINVFKSFNIDNICNFGWNFLFSRCYKNNNKKKKAYMRLQLWHYDFDLSNMDEVLQTIYILKMKLWIILL